MGPSADKLLMLPRYCSVSRMKYNPQKGGGGRHLSGCFERLFTRQIGCLVYTLHTTQRLLTWLHEKHIHKHAHRRTGGVESSAPQAVGVCNPDDERCPTKDERQHVQHVPVVLHVLRVVIIHRHQLYQDCALEGAKEHNTGTRGRGRGGGWGGRRVLIGGLSESFYR